MRKSLFLPLALLLILLSSVRAQDDEDDEEAEEDDESGGNDVNAFDAGYDSGFFPMGSENFEELPGGVFDPDTDSDGDPIDYMDSMKNPSVSPRYMLPSLLHLPKVSSRDFHEDPPFPTSDHHFHFPNRYQQEDPPSIPDDSDDQDQQDSYDPERRRRYTGYDDVREQASGYGEAGSAHDMSQDYERFPKGSFYGMEGLYGRDSRRTRDRLFVPFKSKSFAPRTPCDGGCDG